MWGVEFFNGVSEADELSFKFFYKKKQFSDDQNSGGRGNYRKGKREVIVGKGSDIGGDENYYQ